MIRLSALCFLFFFSCVCLGQDTGKVLFVEDLKSWSDVVLLAKKQNKFICVDCVASWCKPCRQMDQLTYSNASLASYMNDKFLSVKIQFDSTSKDDEFVKSWHSQAALFERKYEIKSYPTYLFFSPQGVLLHRSMGFKNVSDFRSILEEAEDPSKQFYTLLKQYKTGSLFWDGMVTLARQARSLRFDSLADAVAAKYLDSYLGKADDSVFYSKSNIGFISDFLHSKNKVVYKRFRSNLPRIDSSAGKGHSFFVLSRILNEEIILPELYSDKGHKVFKHQVPDWRMLFKRISALYDEEYAKRNILPAKINWFKGHEQWEELGRVYSDYYDSYGVDTSSFVSCLGVNNVCWYDVFLKVNDVSTLKKACKWMGLVVRAQPKIAFMQDTYANLLYKSGDKEAAIRVQESAIANSDKKEEFIETLQKMKAGKPTWSTE